MLFNSVQFLIFFPVVSFLYFMIPHRFRWAMLLVASCIFYMAFIPAYISILAVTIVIDYIAGIWIEKEGEPGKKKFFLIVSIISTCLVLFVFKYFNFFNSNFAAIAGLLHWNYPIGTLRIILPIGLSFHTFQSLSYVIEVYRGHQKAEKNFGIYALYVMFYPQLVAGPIERPQNLLHQFYEEHKVDYRRITEGLRLMLWGLFKKMVVADRLAVFVNQVYNNAGDYKGATLLIATMFFAFQIYCDFSGYSDIALGSAKVMGFTLMKNFDRPYASKSIHEFWKRWHISLSTWFKDYLYISMGGNRVPKWRWRLNLMITFTVSGFWHGANWTFIIWGALNGFYLVASLVTADMRKKMLELTRLNRLPRLHKVVQVLITFLLTCFAWIFFRANSLGDAVHIITQMFNGGGQWFDPATLAEAIKASGLGTINFAFAISAVVVMEVLQYLMSKQDLVEGFRRKPMFLRWVCYYALLLAVIIFGMYGSTHQIEFIYFQF